MSSDTTTEVKSTNTLLVAVYEEKHLSVLLSNTKDEMALTVRGSPTTSCGMFIDKEIIEALIHWLQARIAEM